VPSILNLVKRAVVIGSGETPATKVLRGVRTGDQRALYTGAALMGYQWLKSHSNRRELLYRKEIPEGSAVVVRYGKRGELAGVEIRRVDDLT
jgi:hypothetical protein